MCDFRVSSAELIRDFGATEAQLAPMFAAAKAQFGDMVSLTPEGLAIPPRARPLTRIIARAFDAYDQSKAKHSAAI